MMVVSSLFIAQHVSIDPLDRALTFIRCNQSFRFLRFPATIHFFACVIVSRLDYKEAEGQVQLRVHRPDRSVTAQVSVPYGFAKGSLSSTFFGDIEVQVKGPGIHLLVVSNAMDIEMARFPIEVSVIEQADLKRVMADDAT